MSLGKGIKWGFGIILFIFTGISAGAVEMCFARVYSTAEKTSIQARKVLLLKTS